MLDKGTADKAKGKVKEVTGDVTGDNKKKGEGLVDQAVGKAKAAAEDIKKSLKD